LNLVSRDSGSGKTTILQAINSIYGRPKELMMSPKDTYNVRMQRMGVMQSFAVTMDEITNMPPEQMSNQVYDVTSGRGKNRMKQHENSERHNSTRWQTGMIASSNRSVVDALLSVKGFPDGELKRIMEVQVNKDPHDNPAWARSHFGRLKDHYGHAIEPYAQTLISQLPMVTQKLEEVQTRIDAAAGITNSERYWALMASLAVTGGAIAKQIGLHDIPIKPVFQYAVNLIRETRTKTKEYLFDGDEFLGVFLQRHFHEILVINGKLDKRTGLEHGPIKEPRGALTVRYEPDTKMLFVSTSAYRTECNKSSMNFEESLNPYKKSGAMLTHNGGMSKKKRLFAGTAASNNSGIVCLWFDTTKLGFFNESKLIDNAGNESSAIDPVE
jgi:energy-coupling factor transporter ATP-binding protein EcfA2